MPHDPAPRFKNPIKWFFSNLGPGLVSGAAGLVREMQFLEKLEAEIDGAYELIE